MRKSELIKILATIDGDPLIVMSSDSEGNNYSPLAAIEEVDYLAENSYRGELAEEESEETIKAIALWPTN